MNKNVSYLTYYMLPILFIQPSAYQSIKYIVAYLSLTTKKF